MANSDRAESGLWCRVHSWLELWQSWLFDILVAPRASVTGESSKEEESQNNFPGFHSQIQKREEERRGSKVI